jgi:hypothetical protein
MTDTGQFDWFIASLFFIVKTINTTNMIDLLKNELKLYFESYLLMILSS